MRRDYINSKVSSWYMRVTICHEGRENVYYFKKTKCMVQYWMVVYKLRLLFGWKLSPWRQTVKYLPSTVNGLFLILLT
jgi:hypothetical protein